MNNSSARYKALQRKMLVDFVIIQLTPEQHSRAVESVRHEIELERSKPEAKRDTEKLLVLEELLAALRVFRPLPTKTDQQSKRDE